MIQRVLQSIPVVVLTLAALPGAPARSFGISAFDDAFAKVSNYTVTIHERELKGNQVQDRTYALWFKRPTLEKTVIVSGSGTGSAAVWSGGESVSARKGGVFSFIHAKIGVHDPRVTSLRGYTIPEALVQSQVDKYRELSGNLVEHPGPALDGVRTDEIDLEIADPAANGNVTRSVMYLSATTHFPLRQIQYDGDKIVDYESFTDLKTNVALTESDFSL